MTKQLLDIPVGEIRPNPQQPRQVFGENKLKELAASMAAERQLQPIEVERNGRGYILHHGERRWRAAILNGWEKITAVVVEPQDRETLLVRALVENIQRQDMDTIEEARAYQILLDRGMTKAEIGRRTGKSHAHIVGRLIWLELEEPIQRMVSENRISKNVRVAEALLDLPDNVRLAMAARMDGMSIDAILTTVETYLRQKKAKGKGSYTTEKKSKMPRSESYILDLVPGPHAPGVAAAAKTVCQSCILFQDPMSLTCKECPAVRMVRELKTRLNNE